MARLDALHRASSVEGVSTPKAGDVLIVDRRASVQFNGANALILRVISVCDKATYDGWAWITGYVLDPETGEATVRREIFVLRDGLILAVPRSGLMRGLGDDGLSDR